MEARQRKRFSSVQSSISTSSASTTATWPKRQQHSKKSSTKSVHDQQQQQSEDSTSPPDSITSEDIRSLLNFGNFIIGLCVMMYVGYWFASYISTLHENQMWFTNIQEVEREISFRTESGLYYSYYKQLVHAKDFWKDVHDLTIDNATEHGRTINILQRFNIYPEIVLAAIYRLTPDYWHRLAGGPIFFYIYSTFALNGVYLCVIFATTWLMSGGSWLAGALASAFYIMNLEDTTRVFYTINLRESFALPFFFAQTLLTCYYLRRGGHHGNSYDGLVQLGIFTNSLLFSLSWQFNQFFLFLQALTLYGMGILLLTPRAKVGRLLLLNGAALLVTCAMQMGQPMLLGSMYLSFVPAAILSMYLCRDWRISGGIVGGGLKLVVQTVFTFMMAIPLNIVVKRSLQLEADEHIFKFLKGKFGFADPRDFESRIYLCHGAFVFLDSDFFVRTTTSGHFLFPLYLSVLAGGLFIIGKDILMEWCAPIMPYVRHVPTDRSDPTDKPYCFNKRPDLAFLIVQSAFFGLVSMMALRIKYIWAPHICALAPLVLADRKLWHDGYTAIVSNVPSWKNRMTSMWPADVTRHTLTALLLVTLLWRFAPKYRQQMDELREFWDPDTVELMYWIGNNTTPESSFAGSMQLLAGVKCCTGRHVTNHPHFEDKALRDRTRDVYQMYAHRTAEDVHRILRSFDTNYIILEDSICLAKSDGCRTPDLIDLANGDTPDLLLAQQESRQNQNQPINTEETQQQHEKWMPPGLKKSEIPRFCDEIRRGEENSGYKKLFKLVMQNRTFRVYQLS